MSTLNYPRTTEVIYTDKDFKKGLVQLKFEGNYQLLRSLLDHLKYKNLRLEDVKKGDVLSYRDNIIQFSIQDPDLPVKNELEIYLT